jgi:hypothetical protein
MKPRIDIANKLKETRRSQIKIASIGSGSTTTQNLSMLKYTHTHAHTHTHALHALHTPLPVYPYPPTSFDQKHKDI